jgi:hypothetical protein
MTDKFNAFGFSHPLKTEVEHLLSIAADLNRARSALCFLISPSAGDRAVDAGVIGAALYTQALVSYARCFSSGRRKGIQPEIFTTKPELLAAHMDIKSIRDKHVAHPVSEHEHCSVLVAAENPDAPAVGLGVRYWFYVSGDQKHMRLFLKVTEFAEKYVRKQISAKGNELAKLVMGPQATWKAAQETFHKCVTNEQVFGPTKHEEV